MFFKNVLTCLILVYILLNICSKKIPRILISLKKNSALSAITAKCWRLPKTVFCFLLYTAIPPLTPLSIIANTTFHALPCIRNNDILRP